MDHRINSDVYNKNGALLVSQGTTVSADTYSRLKQLLKQGAVTFDQESKVKNHQCVFEESRKYVRKEFNKINNQLFKRSVALTQDVVFCAKEKPYRILIQTLSNYMESWVYSHSINVSLISLIIADALQLENTYKHEIALGAVLHDIGKLLIPKSILMKKGKLTDAEFVLIKQHCELGLDLIKDYHLPETISDIVYKHHERMDGSGYPQGLQAGQIPLHCQIVIVADVIDAITSYRPYKKMKDIEFALSELNKEPEKYNKEIIAIVASFVS
ncbi:MAG: HD domain-containing phosphohydrolase [Sporolactobacillus sp.]